MSNLIKIPGVMTREMVKTYGTERVYAPAEELRKATELTDMVPICMYKDREHGALDLPDDEILGWALLWYEDGKVKTNLLFDPLKMSDAQLVMLANLEKHNLSPAFRSIPVIEQGAWQGQAYESKQTDIEWKHIAVVETGRCSDLHGCGLYKDHFDGLDVPTRDKITRCVELLLSKGHQPEAAEEICLAAYKDQGVSHLETVNNTGEYYGGPVNITDYSIVNVTREDQMPSECVEKKVAEGMSKEEAAKACAPASSDAEKIAQLEAANLLLQAKLDAAEKIQRVEQVHQKFGIPTDQLEQKDLPVLDAMMSFELPVGQPITGERRDSKPPTGTETADAEDEDEDPDTKPGLFKTINPTYRTDAAGAVIDPGTPVRVHLDLETLKTKKVS